MALQRGFVPLLDESHEVKGPYVGPVNPGKDISCPGALGRALLGGPPWAPRAVSGLEVPSEDSQANL